MKILITGCSGFIGKNFTTFFAEGGHEVFGIDRNETILKHRNFCFFKQDIVNDKFPTNIKEIDVVIHLAADTSMNVDGKDLKQSMVDGFGTTLHTLNWARTQTKAPLFMFASSSKFYDDNLYPYSACKKISEMVIRLFNKYGIPYVIFRQGTIWGKYQDMWLEKFDRAIKEDKEIVVSGDGTQMRDLLSVTDLAKMYQIAMMNPELHNNTFDIGGGYEFSYSINEVISLLEKANNKKAKVLYTGGKQDGYITTSSTLDPYWKPTTRFEGVFT